MIFSAKIGVLNKSAAGYPQPRIYQHVAHNKQEGGTLYIHLRCRKKRRKRYGSTDRRGKIKNRVSIDHRPSIVEERSRTGDWEVDTVIGRQGGAVLITLAERKTRFFSVIALAPDKRADSVKQALVQALLPYQAQVHTLTCDNGKEFALHQEFASTLQADCFFAHPYQAWQRAAQRKYERTYTAIPPKRGEL